MNIIEKVDIDSFEYKKVGAKMIIAVKIADGIKAAGISKQDFARKIGVAPSIITKWLSGHQNFTVDTLCEIEHVLKINLMVSDIEAPKTPEYYYKSIIDNYEFFKTNQNEQR